MPPCWVASAPWKPIATHCTTAELGICTSVGSLTARSWIPMLWMPLRFSLIIAFTSVGAGLMMAKK